MGHYVLPAQVLSITDFSSSGSPAAHRPFAASARFLSQPLNIAREAN
jgi:hypothetical protein